MTQKNEEVNIEALLEYIEIIKKQVKYGHVLTAANVVCMIEVQLLDCRLNFRDKYLHEVKDD